MNRRSFLKGSSAVFFLLQSGEIFSAAEAFDAAWKKKTVLRFVIASDGHYGQKNTDYERFFSEGVHAINTWHTKNPFAFCVFNGDIIHDDKKWLPEAKTALDKLAMKYYVTQGNHDHVTPQEWEATWNMPVNFDFTIGKNSFLLGTTSNEQGTYLCPDLDWLSQKLEAHKKQKNVFLFIHINPAKLTKYAVDCPDFLALLAKHKNVRAVFNGHDHDEDHIKIKEKIPFLFDGHIGGNWGTDYRGIRVVELKKDNSIFTYMLNPSEKMKEYIF